MDPLVEAIYRSGCLVAASRMVPPMKVDTEANAVQRELVDFASDLFERMVPEHLREGEMLDTGVLTEHPQSEAFLEDMRRRAAEAVAAKDKEKAARAVAMADKDAMEHAESETTLT
jgi:hypothetical protein